MLGGWALHDTYTTHQNAKASRALITRACAGLVDADAVMRLDGGTDRVVLGGDEPRTVGFEGLPDSCVLSRVVERHGREVQLSQFTLDIRGLPQERVLHTVEDFPDEPFTTLDLGSQGDMTARTRLPDRMPLGDGRLGDYGPDDVTVVARCEQPAEDGTTTLIVTATSPGTGDEAGDRPVLARLARQAAVGAAAEYGCRAQLPELPDRLPQPVVDLGPAAGDRSDSCGWYAAHLRTADGATLPDRAAGVPSAEPPARRAACSRSVPRRPGASIRRWARSSGPTWTWTPSCGSRPGGSGPGRTSATTRPRSRSRHPAGGSPTRWPPAPRAASATCSTARRPARAGPPP